MKKIGYIYKYNHKEKRGILVYGRWRESVDEAISFFCRPSLKDRPILFGDTNCTSSVATGQLVSFELFGDKANNIHQISLANFDKEIIEEIITGHSYYCHPYIMYERLDDLFEWVDATKEGTVDDFDDVDFDLDWNRYGETHTNQVRRDISVPTEITDLYECFGKYEHRHLNKDSIYVDILDLSLWMKGNTIKKKFFGETLDEALYLYNVFYRRMYYDNRGQVQYCERENDMVSPAWKILLNKLNHEVLGELLKHAPKLQPVLPEAFCKENINLLSDKYRMPNTSICKLYCLYKIEQIETTLDYKKMAVKLSSYAKSKWSEKYIEGEGATLWMMREKDTAELSRQLDSRYNSPPLKIY